ncbi:MAG: P13 family porin [Candidatus Margulisiibacteriota bacterium]
MKTKIIFTTAVFMACFLSAAFSAESSLSEINEYIDQGLDQNFYQIKTTASSLSQDDRRTIYELKKKDWVRAQELNIVPGLGIGSFLQGDDYGGKIALIGEAACIAITWGLTKDNRTKSEENTAYIAAYAFLGFKLFEIFRPGIYTNDYNKKLEEALGLTAQIVPDKNGSLALKLSTGF